VGGKDDARSRHVKITGLASVEQVAVTMEGARNVRKGIPIGAADGTPNLSVRVFTIDPDGHTPYHRHDFEHLNYVIRGSGVIVTETGEERAIDEGDFALVLPGEKHRYRNTSAREPLVMICAVPKAYE
jgi:quercetin dioxygenase-like cupin family protein